MKAMEMPDSFCESKAAAPVTGRAIRLVTKPEARTPRRETRQEEEVSHNRPTTEPEFLPRRPARTRTEEAWTTALQRGVLVEMLDYENCARMKRTFST
jgi:hypothetical protein